MAYTKVLIVVALIAGVEHALSQYVGGGGGAAAFAGAGAGLFGPNFPFGYVGLPQPPQLPMFGAVGFPNFQVPSPADIVNMQPGPNSDVHGIMTMTSFHSEMGPDGQYKRTGGTTILSKEGDKVEKVEFGDSPPPVKSYQSNWVSS